MPKTKSLFNALFTFTYTLGKYLLNKSLIDVMFQRFISENVQGEFQQTLGVSV